MGNKLNLFIMGGDTRQIEVAKIVAQKGVNVHMVGFNQVADADIDSMKIAFDKIDYSQVDAFLVPVSGIGEKGEIEAHFSEESIILTEGALAKTPEHCVVYTGISTPYLDQLIEATNRKLVPLFKRNDMAILNSIPTAEGALKIAIENTDTMIHGSRISVLGYGRIGKTIARVFSAIGANVRVGARKAEDLARITEVGLTPFHLNNLDEEIIKTDICINTIPKLILTQSIISKMSKHTLILDVASKPGGTEFEYAKKAGIKTIWALGLPGKFAPKSAGEILGKVFSEVLEEDFK
jgi:dipicolinate synthase subunit A